MPGWAGEGQTSSQAARTQPETVQLLRLAQNQLLELYGCSQEAPGGSGFWCEANSRLRSKTGDMTILCPGHSIRTSGSRFSMAPVLSFVQAFSFSSLPFLFQYLYLQRKVSPSMGNEDLN